MSANNAGLRARYAARVATVATALLAASVLLTGCPPCPGQVLDNWQFEGCDGGPTCGWQTVRGAAAPAESLLPGEHGLQIAGDSEIEQQMEIMLFGSQSTEAVLMVARCEAGTSLRIDQFVNESRVATRTDGGSAQPPSAAPQLRRASADARPGVEWTPVTAVLRPVSSAPLPAVGTTGSARRVAFSLRIATVGSGACVIDRVQYNSSLGGGCFL